MKAFLMSLSTIIISALLAVGLCSLSHSDEVFEGKVVGYKSGGETVSGYIVTPKGKGPFPGIVMIHEWWGLNDHIKDMAVKLGNEGYVVLAVDLYRGKVTSDPNEAHELSRGLPVDRAIADLRAAVKYLKSLANVISGKIGSIGWCMGGGYSLSLAVNEPALATSVIYYGRLITDKEKLGKITAPVLGFFGENDRGIPQSSVVQFKGDMENTGKEAEIFIYPNAGHAFANPTRPSYNESAAIDSWNKTLLFFDKNLKQ